jgi:hypothetical protein
MASWVTWQCALKEFFVAIDRNLRKSGFEKRLSAATYRFSRKHSEWTPALQRKSFAGRRTNCQRPPHHDHEGIDHLGFAKGYAILGQDAERSHNSHKSHPRRKICETLGAPRAHTEEWVLKSLEASRELRKAMPSVGLTAFCWLLNYSCFDSNSLTHFTKNQYKPHLIPERLIEFLMVLRFRTFFCFHSR